MASRCFSTVRGKAIRVTRVDACCRPVCGTNAFGVSTGFISVNYTAEIEDEEELQVKNANGDICVIDTTCPSLKYYSVEIEFCNVDPELWEILTGQPLVADFAGVAVGQRVGEQIRCDGGFALELWAGTPDAACDELGDILPNFGYFLTPCIVNGIMGDFTVENDVATFTVSGRTKRGTGWGRGPFDVVPQDIGGTPGRLLDAWRDREHLHMQLTSIAPPTAQCGVFDGPQITVLVETDADGDGTFSSGEQATTADADVPVRITITNSGEEATRLDAVSLTDGTTTWDVDAGASGFTGPAVPNDLAVGGIAVYNGTLTGWSPAVNARKALVATGEHRGDTSGMYCSDFDTDSVTTVGCAPVADFNGTDAAAQTNCPNPTTWTDAAGETATITAGTTCGTIGANPSLEFGPGESVERTITATAGCTTAWRITSGLSLGTPAGNDYEFLSMNTAGGRVSLVRLSNGNIGYETPNSGAPVDTGVAASVSSETFSITYDGTNVTFDGSGRAPVVVAEAGLLDPVSARTGNPSAGGPATGVEVVGFGVTVTP